MRAAMTSAWTTRRRAVGRLPDPSARAIAEETPPPIAPAEVICRSMINGTSSTPGADSRASVGTMGAASSRSVRGFKKEKKKGSEEFSCNTLQRMRACRKCYRKIPPTPFSCLPRSGQRPGDDERSSPAESDTDAIGQHVEELEAAIAGPALDEFQRHAHRGEAGRIGELRASPAVELRKPEHHAAVRDEVTHLVALLEVDLRRRRREREPYDGRDQPPADSQPDRPQVFQK